MRKLVICLFMTVCAVASQAQDLALKVDDERTVEFNGTSFYLDAHFEVPEGEALQQYLANIIFGVDGVSMEDAYADFLKRWSPKSEAKPKGTIVLDLRKEYEQGGRFACYHVKALLKGSVQLSGQPQTASAQRSKAQYFHLAKGVDQGFIYDIARKEIVTTDQILVPAVAEQIKRMLGTDVNLYAEDRCLQFYSKKGDGRFIFNETTEPHFTDYFKQLVGWGKHDYPTPQFLRGQKGLEHFFSEAGFDLADNGEAADTVSVSLIVSEDGSASHPSIERHSAYAAEDRLLALCAKMPKWKPAYEGGKPVTKEAFFSLKVRKFDKTRVFDVVEQMPEFPGGEAALKKYLAENIHYPKIAEENGIQGRVVCTFVVERNGSITDIKVIRSVDPSLDKEARRVIASMPRWAPGAQNGEPVRVKYTMPITFHLK